jgi:ArsR family transcriptional regulator
MQTAYRERADRLKAMGHPLRLQILDVLRREPECVCHLSAAFGKSQPHVSQQLAILRNAGVIVDEREGANVFYRLADAESFFIVEAALGPLPPGEQASRGSHRPVGGCNCPKCAGVIARAA